MNIWHMTYGGIIELAFIEDGCTNEAVDGFRRKHNLDNVSVNMSRIPLPDGWELRPIGATDTKTPTLPRRKLNPRVIADAPLLCYNCHRDLLAVEYQLAIIIVLRDDIGAPDEYWCIHCYPLYR